MRAKGRAKLKDWQLKKLDELNFKWTDNIKSEKEKNWYSMYRQLEEFYNKYGHSDVPEYWSENVSLSIWVMSQRRPKKKLSNSKINLLRMLKFSFNSTIGFNKRDEKGRFLKRC